MTVVVDSSAILALLFGEPGAEAVRRRLEGATVSTVSLAESHAKLIDRDYPEEDARLALEGLALRAEPLDEEGAWRLGLLRSRFRRSGLSFDDCACLALAAGTGRPALTGDRLWRDLDHGVAVETIR